LIQLINQSIYLKKYDIAYEVTKKFKSDLLKIKVLPIFDSLFNHFNEDKTRYEAKIALVMNYLPLMNFKLANRFLKIIE